MTQLTDLSYNVLTEMYRATGDKKQYYEGMATLIGLETLEEIEIRVKI